MGHNVWSVEPTTVRFDASGVELVGHLRIPDGAGAAAAGIVLTGPFTGVKDQVAGDYADRLATAGFVTLAFDHRNFGESGGDRRQHEDPGGKLEDLRAATSFLSAHDAVDGGRVGCVGICMGGGYALKHAAFDPRIRALAVVAAAFNDPKAMRSGIGAEGYRSMMHEFALVAAGEQATGDVDMIRAVSDVEGEDAAMPGAEPFEYYGTERSASAVWRNDMTRLSVRELLTFDAAIGADFLAPTPALFVHGRTDGFCSPEAASDTFDRVTGPKEFLWLDTTNHIELYDNPTFVDPAVDRVADWMRSNLA